jgi:Tol biopolymer transport system component
VEIGNQDICTIKPDGSGLERLTTDPSRDYGAAFPRAGDRIAFVTERFGSETIAVLENGGTVRGVIQGTYPSWSPDGTRIAFTFGGDIFTVSAAGGTAVNLTNDGLGYYAPVWSPDGSDVAFGGTSIAGYTGILLFRRGCAQRG